MEERYTLPGQEEAESALRAAAARNALSHAILLTGSAGAPEAARFAAAALECTAEEGQPCGVCRACRKVREGIHPDVTVVRDPDHKNIAVDIIRDLRNDAYIRPNEGKRKVYIFPDCSVLPEQGQNILLKIVEEGPPYAAFLFCAENGSAVLQTLRSRCVEIKLRARRREEELGEAALALCTCLAGKKRGAVVTLAVKLEKKKLPREEIRKTAQEKLRLVGLDEGYFKRLPAMLSGGEQQRVAVARALAAQARVILADEPTGNLDTDNASKVIELLRTLAHEQGVCVIVVTHDLSIADRADAVFRLKDGQLDETPAGA